MASPHKRPSAPFDAPPSVNSAEPNTEGSCEPPRKKLCQLQDGDSHPSLQSSGPSRQAPEEPAPTSTSTNAPKIYGEDLDLDEFNTLEELVASSQNSQATLSAKCEVTVQTDPVPSTEVDVDVLKSDATKGSYAAAERGVTTQPEPVSYTKADLAIPTIDTGEESDDSSIIDLTQKDAEIQIGRSDGFIGVIKSGTPGITVKREGRFNATPTRRALAPLSTNTASPHKLDNRKSIYASLTPEPESALSGLKEPGHAPRGGIMPEDAENLMQSLTHAPSMLRYEDSGPLAQEYEVGLVKLGDEDMKPHCHRYPTDGSPKPTSSPSFDMTKFLINEQNLAAMPCASQPPQLKTKLLKHQCQALRWMSDMEQPHDPHSGPSAKLAGFWGPSLPHATNVDEGVSPNKALTPFSGGILADDMGLGKTLEMIALILKEPKGGPSLIVAPKGVLTNWESQIRRHIFWKHAPAVFRYHGSRLYVTPSELERYDIVITTYNKVADEAYDEGTLRKVRWRRVILDEGHTIRNPDSMAALATCRLRAKSRWVCTGTPIINYVNDIYSLCKFIGVTDTLRKPPPDVIRRLKNDHQFLQNVMTTICLRRTKEMRFVNLKLPPKEEELIRIKFSEPEDAMYQKLLVDAKEAAEMFFKTRRYELWTHLLERLLRLRQMCDHWSLGKMKGVDNCRKKLHDLLREAKGCPDETQLGELLHLSLEANIACGFCAEPLHLECYPVICPCAHVYCKACILTPIQDILTCPMCNDSFDVTRIIEMGSVPRPANEVPDRHQHSTKTETLISLVKQRLRNKASKIVIFSQWTSFLDIVGHHLGEEEIGHVRIDGTMSTSLRDDAVRALDRDPNVRVLLASLRAAGVGINLTSADTAILADSWWAPAIEEQAIDRVHRLGQTRRTKVYRLVVQGAVEEGVIHVQDRKRELVGTAFQEDFKALSNVSLSGMIKKVLDWSE